MMAIKVDRNRQQFYKFGELNHYEFESIRIEDAIEKLQEVQDDANKNGALPDTITLNIETDYLDAYNESPTIKMTYYYKRMETDEELDSRIKYEESIVQKEKDKKALRRKEKKEKEIAELNRLFNKYGHKVIED